MIRLSARLPRTSAGKHVAGQILRCGTSPAPNCSEARAAESHADFIHKLGIVLKELNESLVWLKIIGRSEIVRAELLADVLDENRQLCKIITSSISTARARSTSARWEMIDER